ncbi:MAG: 1,2-phenylacetyl-CoA epoxidase subunit PaaE [Flavobacteriales bacterium]
MSLKFHTVQISSIRSLTDDSAEISFEIPAEITSTFNFNAGQYLTFRIQLNGEEIRRSYSLCSAPFEGQYRIGIKRVEKGLFSNYALNQLHAGDTIEVMPPAGNFKYETNPAAKKNIVLFAAGSGITPILSIAKTILHEEPHSTVSLFFGNKGFSKVMFAEELEQLKNNYLTRLRIFHVFSQESQGIPIQKGRIDHDRLIALHQAFLSHDIIDGVYVCGPEQMILSVKSFFEKKGLAAHQIHFELFHAGNSNKTNAIEEKRKISTCEVELIIDDDLISFQMEESDKNVLDAAQRAGADVPFACKGGVCCTCKAKILEGEAEMLVNYALEPEEVKSGYVLTCQAIPTSNKITISFDE